MIILIPNKVYDKWYTICYKRFSIIELNINIFISKSKLYVKNNKLLCMYVINKKLTSSNFICEVEKITLKLYVYKLIIFLNIINFLQCFISSKTIYLELKFIIYVFTFIFNI